MPSWIGGWHDAGDYNKYTVNAAFTVGTMLKAWEHFREKLAPLTFDIPESGNQTPDFLDEVRWELDWLLKMQAADGRVYHKVSALKSGGFELPEKETERRYFSPWSSAATADFVAIMAEASRADAAYSSRCLAAAKKSYEFLQANPTDHRPDSDRHVIARVSDNIHAGKGKKVFACYQTTFEGLHEDSLAYSDNRNHQWNGLTAAGLPNFLCGADYIETFNDYRYMEDFEMKVELARPANLYIFFDDRVETPDWLKANFEDTGVDIGLDEGPWGTQVDEKFRKLDVNTTASGGGNSIDNIFSVWRRRCVDGGTVTLGNAGAWAIDRKDSAAREAERCTASPPRHWSEIR
jgi:hypothetical protein